MVRSRFWAVVALMSLTGAVALPSASHAQFVFPTPRPQATQSPAPGPATDPRVAQMKDGLEKQGLRVLNVELRRTPDNEPQWLVQTAARYAQPGWPSVISQAFAVWGLMYSLAANDPPKTWFSGIQVWNKYGIAVHVRLEDLTTLAGDLRNTKTDTEKQVVLEKFYPRVSVKIWDYERQKFVDFKDFVNKNFTS